MGRFSPNVPVQDRSGEILAAAIGQAFDSVLQRRRMKQHDAERQEDRQRQHALQDFRLAEDHVRLTKPGEVPHELSNVANGIQLNPDATAPDWARLASQGGALQPKGGPLVTPREGPAVRMGNGWVQDMDGVRSDRRAAREQQFQDELAKALMEQRVQDMTNPGARELAYKTQQARLAEILARTADRQDDTPAVRNIDPLSGEGIRAAVDRARQLMPYRSTGRDGNGRSGALVTLGQQIDETGGDLRRLQSEAQKLEELAANELADPSARAAARQRLSALRPRLGQLETRKDSLQQVRDRRAGVEMGTLPARTGLGGHRAQPSPAPADPRAQQEFNAAAAKYQQALDLGIPEAQAREAYSQSLQRIARKYGVDR